MRTFALSRAEIVRIYSTSGTTGDAELHPADCRRPGQLGHRLGSELRGVRRRGPASASSRPTTRGRSSRARRSPRSTASGSRTSRSARATPSGSSGRSSTLRPEAAVLTPSYAAYLAENFDLRGSSVERVLVAGEPGGGEPGFRAKLEEGWGAKVTEAMGIGDIGVSLWGECDGAGRHASGCARLRPRRAGRPARPASRSRWRTAPTGELVLTHLQHRAAPLLRFRTRDHVLVRTGRARAAAPGRASAASGAPTTC